MIIRGKLIRSILLLGTLIVSVLSSAQTIRITGNGIDINDDNTTHPSETGQAFGVQQVGVGSVTRTFTIHNDHPVQTMDRKPICIKLTNLLLFIKAINI